jgi:hypothetical protein
MGPGRVAIDGDGTVAGAAQHLHVAEIVDREKARPAVDADEAVRRLESLAVLPLGKMLAVVPVLEFLLDVRRRLHRRQQQALL